MDQCTVNCKINDGQNVAVRPTVSIAGVIGFTLRPFSLENSNIYYSGYFQRLNHFKMNRAVVAVVPNKYLVEATGSTADNMAMTPKVAGSTITNCKIGGVTLGEWDDEDQVYEETKLSSSNYHNFIYGSGNATDWTGTDNYDGCTLLTSAPTFE